MRTKLIAHITTFTLAVCIILLIAIPAIVYKFNQKEIKIRIENKKILSEKTSLIIHPTTPLQLFVK